MTNRAVQIYDDNPEMIRLKSDINDIQNWKVVRESFRQFDAERPGPGIILRNRDTGMYYRTTEEYPWLIHGIGDEIYVDSDDLKIEDLTGRPIKFSRGSTIPSNPGYITIRVAGAKHQDSLKGSSAVDLQNCRQFYAFYLNPNKYDAKALNEFTLTVNNEFSRGSVCNGEVKKQIYGLGNFLICRTYGEMHKPDFTTIDLIPGDVFIQRFNAKPFGLKKIDEAIEQYRIDMLRGNANGSEVFKVRESELPSSDKLRIDTAKSAEDIKNEYIEYLTHRVMVDVANMVTNLASDEDITHGRWYDAKSWVYQYNNLPEKLLNKIKDMKSVKNPDVVSLYKIQDSDTKVKLKATLIATVNQADKDNIQFYGDINTVLIVVIKKGKDKKYKQAFRMRFQGDVQQSLSKYLFRIFENLVPKIEAYGFE